MTDTIRLPDALAALLADNTAGDISAQDVRDFLATALPGGRGPTKVVAASGTSTARKAAADYRCDGTADQADIELALADLASLGGGTLVLTEGIFTLSADITLTASNIEIIGAGPGATALVLANGANCNMFKVGAGGISKCRFAGFTMNGNKTNQSDQAARDDLSGFLFPDGAAQCSDISFENIIATNFRHGASMRLNNILRLRLKDVTAHTNGVVASAFSCDGIFVGSCSYSRFSGVVSYLNTDTGLAMDGCDMCVVSDSHAYTNTEQGFAMGQGSAYILYANCTSHANSGADSGHGHGWKLHKFGGSATNNAFFTNCVARQNGGSGLHVTDHTGLLWDGGSLSGNAFDINPVSGNALIYMRPMAPIMANNGSALIASGSTTATVAHGLGVTPGAQDISVTPTTFLGAATQFKIGSVDATNFVITLNADPLATVGFSWQARKLKVA